MAKNFDLDSSVKVGVTDIVGKARGPRSRKEKLAERESRETTAPDTQSIAAPSNPSPKPEEKKYSEVPAHNERSVTAQDHSSPVQRPIMSTQVSTHDERSSNTQNVSLATEGLIKQARDKKIALQLRHLKILQFLKNNLVTENGTRLIYHRQISEVTAIPFASVRRYMSELQSLGVIIHRQKAWSNGYQGNYYHLNLVKTREFLGMMESIRYMSAEFNEPRGSQRSYDRSMPVQNEHSLNTNSSSSNFKNNSTTTEAAYYDLTSLDVEEFPGLDIESLVRFRMNYSSLDAFQDFIDRVAYAIAKSRGTSSELRNPTAFLIKSLERRYINVDSGYKSRAMKREEEELRARQAEVDEMKRIRDERKRVEAERTKLKFEEWLESESQRRAQDFERERAKTFPSSGGQYDVPASIRAKQLLQIQADTFLVENGLPLTLRESLLR